MRFNYGEMNSLRALEEAEFWKHQEGEHTQVIQEVVMDLEDEYVDKLIEYKGIFDATEARLIQYIETIINLKNSITPEMEQEIMQMINLTIMQSQVFIDFLGKLIKESTAVSNNPIANVVIHHIRRESEYYIGIVKAFLAHMNDQNNEYDNNNRYDNRYENQYDNRYDNRYNNGNNGYDNIYNRYNVNYEY